MSWLDKGRVVIPIDFSDESFKAVDVARMIAGGSGHLHVIHVLSPMPIDDRESLWTTDTDETPIQKCEDTLRKRFAGEEHHRVRIRVSVGNPGNEITAYAEEIGADLIVLPSHGRTGIKRLLIGSVAERVCRIAPCPVLVLRD